MSITAEEMWLRWAYCEASTDRFSDWCPNPDIDELRLQIQDRRKRFSTLTDTDKSALLEWIAATRKGRLGHYTGGIEHFVERHLSKGDVEQAWCMTELNDGQSISLKELFARPAKAGALKDFREAADQIRNWDCDQMPVTFGIWRGCLILIDGYTRSLLFLTHASPGDTLRAYIPVLPASC